jgi:hypothetical protein
MFGPEAGIFLYGYVRRELRTARTAPSSGLGKGEKRMEKPKVDMFGLEPGSEIFLIPHKRFVRVLIMGSEPGVSLLRPSHWIWGRCMGAQGRRKHSGAFDRSCCRHFVPIFSILFDLLMQRLRFGDSSMPMYFCRSPRVWMSMRETVILVARCTMT